MLSRSRGKVTHELNDTQILEVLLDIGRNREHMRYTKGTQEENKLMHNTRANMNYTCLCAPNFLLFGSYVSAVNHCIMRSRNKPV